MNILNCTLPISHMYTYYVALSLPRSHAGWLARKHI